jgi:hypothetical protein
LPCPECLRGLSGERNCSKNEGDATVTYKTIERKLEDVLKRRSGRTSRIAGVAVRTEYFPAIRATQLIVLGESFSFVEGAAKMVFAYQVED